LQKGKIKTEIVDIHRILQPTLLTCLKYWDATEKQARESAKYAKQRKTMEDKDSNSEN
jgi:hypothetical protein